jgi:hypothetical protein
MSHTCCLRETGEAQRLGRVDGERLFAVDVFAGGDRFFDAFDAHAGHLGVEVDRVVLIGERGGEVSGPAGDVVFAGNVLEPGGAASDQDGIGDETRAVRQFKAA